MITPGHATDIVSEQNYKQLFSQAPAPIAIYRGRELRYVFVNEAYSQIFNQREILNKTVREAFPELEGQGYFEILESVYNTGNPFYANETPATIDINNDGRFSTRYYNLVYTPFKNEQGIIEGVMAFGHDVTDQVNARQKTEEVKERLNFRNALFEAQNATSPDGMLIVDAKGKILLYNRRFTEIWNMPQEILDGQDDSAALRHAMTLLIDPQGYIDRVKALYSDFQQSSYDLLLFKDGRTIERHGAPVVAENGLYYGWAWNFRDITDWIKQEQKFRNVVEQAPDPILILKGEDMALEVANDALFRLWNVDQGAIGKTFLEILPEMKGQGFLELLQNVYHSGEAFYGVEVPAVFERSGGKKQTVYFNFSYQPYREADGTTTGVLVLATDVTGQVLAKQQLVASEQNLRNMILQAPVPIGIFRGEDLVVEIANNSMFQLWSKAPEEVLNKPLFQAIPEAKHQGYEELLTNVLKTGQSFTANELTVTLYRQGVLETVFINIAYEPLREPDGSVSGVLAMATDVTEQVLARRAIEQMVTQRTKELGEANEALIKSNDDLKRSNASLEEFANAASHDLKEPLRKVQFFTDQLKGKLDKVLDAEATRLIERIGDATSRMRLLVEDLLEYSHVSHLSQQMEEVNLNEKIKLVLSDLEVVVEEKQASFTIGSLPMVKGYRRQLQQLFQNLISNALKYSKPHISPDITIISHEVRGENAGIPLPAGEWNSPFYLIEVKDNGIGFDQSNSELIFQMFKRLHGKSEYSGTGVGLAIVKKVVQNHNGYIWAEGQSGIGATFKVLLPVH
jgi:PAS domain S-box-containing protein